MIQYISISYQCLWLIMKKIEKMKSNIWLDFEKYKLNVNLKTFFIYIDLLIMNLDYLFRFI